MIPAGGPIPEGAPIGIIQPRGLGDIVIALPIAAHYAKRGHKVLWPVDQRFLPTLAPHVPYVEFLPFAFEDTPVNYADVPEILLRGRGVERILSLFHHLDGQPARSDPDLAFALKFDEYKYAVAGVPFAEKWTLDIARDPAREADLIASLDLGGAPYVLVHRHASNASFDFNPPPDWAPGHRLIEIDARTQNAFDWLGALEGASRLVLIDSVFANLVDQLGIGGEKYFAMRSPVSATPVLRGAWTRWLMPGARERATY